MAVGPCFAMRPRKIRKKHIREELPFQHERPWVSMDQPPYIYIFRIYTIYHRLFLWTTPGNSRKRTHTLVQCNAKPATCCCTMSSLFFTSVRQRSQILGAGPGLQSVNVFTKRYFSCSHHLLTCRSPSGDAQPARLAFECAQTMIIVWYLGLCNCYSVC